MIISIANQKGGVGKTTLTFHISGALTEKVDRVLVIDMDAQANLTRSFGVDVNPSIADVLQVENSIPLPDVIHKTNFPQIDIIPSNKKLGGLDARMAHDEDTQYFLSDELQDVKGQYDYILIDCPPMLGKATRMALVASDYVIIPIECKSYAFEGSANIIEYITGIQKRANPGLKLLGFVVNELDIRRAIEKGYREALQEQFNDSLFKTEIKRSVKYTEAEAPNIAKPISFYLPRSIEADMVRELTGEIVEKVII